MIFNVSATSSRSITRIWPRSRRCGRANGAAELSLLLDYVEGRKGEAVADPYYGKAAGFEMTRADVTIRAEALARRIAAKR
jgi:protein-tyrosine phosphatase